MTNPVPPARLPFEENVSRLTSPIAPATTERAPAMSHTARTDRGSAPRSCPSGDQGSRGLVAGARTRAATAGRRATGARGARPAPPVAEQQGEGERRRRTRGRAAPPPGRRCTARTRYRSTRRRSGSRRRSRRSGLGRSGPGSVEDEGDAVRHVPEGGEKRQSPADTEEAGDRTSTSVGCGDPGPKGPGRRLPGACQPVIGGVGRRVDSRGPGRGRPVAVCSPDHAASERRWGRAGM